MKKISFVALISCFIIQPVIANDVLPLNPGLWESTVTSTNSFTGTQTHTRKECVVEDHFDPLKMAEGTGQCERSESNLDGNTLSFTMNCSMEGGSATMSGTYTSEGDSGTGTMNMEGSFGGQSMTMESTMTTTRIGDC